jgi:hypothetical protein
VPSTQQVPSFYRNALTARQSQYILKEILMTALMAKNECTTWYLLSKPVE